jgi:hypothetical protein
MRTKPTGCTSRKGNGDPCLAALIPGRDVCRWHSTDPADRERHQAESRRGGLSKAYSAIPSVAPLAETAGVSELDLATPTGLRAFLAATLRALAHLPLDTRVANAIAQVVTCQRSVLETSDFEERLRILETTRHTSLKRA